MNPADISRLLTPLKSRGSAADARPFPIAADETFQILAVCDPGALDDRLRKAARALGQDVTFARSFPAALATIRERFYDVVVVAKVRNGMEAREFVREAKKINGDVVIVIAAPGSEYHHLIEVMVEGGYDFLPHDADDDRLKLVLGRAMNHARLRRRSGELERALDVQTSSLRQRVHELAMLNEMTREMSSVPDLDEILRRALRRILDAFGCECGSFLILDPDRRELVVRAAEGPSADDLIGLRRRLGEGVSGKVASQGHPVLVTDIDSDSRFKDDALRATGTRHYRSRSFVAVPLIHRGVLLGELNLTEKTCGAPFTQDDLRLLSILGGHVASAVSGALAAEELKHANQSLKQRISSTRDSLRTAGERLTRAECLANAVASVLPAAVAAFDRELRITFANESAKELLGLEQGASLKGHPALSDLTALADAAVEVMEQGSTKHLSSGTRLEGCASNECLSIVVAPLRLPDGSLSGGTVVATPANCPLARSKET